MAEVIFRTIAGGRMDRFKDWKKGEGRLSRNGYILYFLAPGAALLAATWLALTIAPQVFLSGISSMFLALPWVVYLATADGQNIRRYHDIGHSGRWYRVLRPGLVGLPVLALILNFVLPAHMAMAGDMQALVYMMGQDMNGFSFGPIPTALFALTLAGVAYNAIYLSVMPGQAGPNEYGPDPNGGVTLPGFDAAAPQSAENDPVKRALTDYQARQTKQARPAAMVTQVRPAPGGTFGKRRV